MKMQTVDSQGNPLTNGESAQLERWKVSGKEGGNRPYNFKKRGEHGNTNQGI